MTADTKCESEHSELI